MNSLLIILFIMIRRSLRPNRGAENRRETTDTASGMNEYDSFDDFWEDNRDEYADEEEAWDAWCDG